MLVENLSKHRQDRLFYKGHPVHHLEARLHDAVPLAHLRYELKLKLFGESFFDLKSVYFLPGLP